MTENQKYQTMVEERFGKPLKEIMYDLCVVQEVVPTEGAYLLNVPKNIFIQWRNKFRFRPIQRRNDELEKREKEIQEEYAKDIEQVDIFRTRKFSGEPSLESLDELLGRLMEVKKVMNVRGIGFSIVDIQILQMFRNYIEKYRSGKLEEQLEFLLAQLE